MLNRLQSISEKRVKISQGRAWRFRFLVDSVRFEMEGKTPKKHYITDIDIYEHFHGKRLFLEKASALPGKSISIYLHLDYIFEEYNYFVEEFEYINLRIRYKQEYVGR